MSTDQHRQVPREEQPWEGIHGRRGRTDVIIGDNNVYTLEETNAWLGYLGLAELLPGETLSQWQERTKTSDKGENNGAE